MNKRIAILVLLLFVITNVSIFSSPILAQEKSDRQTTTTTTTTTSYDERGNPIGQTIESGNTVEQILPKRYIPPATNVSIYSPPQGTEKPKEETSEGITPTGEDIDAPPKDPAVDEVDEALDKALGERASTGEDTDVPPDDLAVDEVEDALDKVLGERASATVTKEKTKDSLKTAPSSQEDDMIKKSLEAYKIKKRSVSLTIYKKGKVVEHQDPYKQYRGDVLDRIPELPEYKPEEESEPSDHERDY